jgi:hypothetical protein
LRSCLRHPNRSSDGSFADSRQAATMPVLRAAREAQRDHATSALLSEHEGALISDYQYPCFRLLVPLFPTISTLISYTSALQVISDYQYPYFRLSVPLFPSTSTLISDYQYPYFRQPTADAGTWRGDRPPRVADAAAPALGRQRRRLLLHRCRGFGSASRGRSGARTKRRRTTSEAGCAPGVRRVLCARCASVLAGRLCGPLLSRPWLQWDWGTLEGAAGPLLLLVLGSGSGSG